MSEAPIAGKFDGLNPPFSDSKSMAWLFFTEDYSAYFLGKPATGTRR